MNEDLKSKTVQDKTSHKLFWREQKRTKNLWIFLTKKSLMPIVEIAFP
jgi:hypothetical protein